MRIYLAAPFAARDLAYEIATRLEDQGHEVTSSWLKSTREINEGSVGASADLDTNQVTIHAVDDLGDISAADAVLMLSSSYVSATVPGIREEWLHTGGRHVEVGFAIARGIPVYIVGQAENVFGRTLCVSGLDLHGAFEMLNRLGPIISIHRKGPAITPPQTSPALASE